MKGLVFTALILSSLVAVAGAKISIDSSFSVPKNTKTVTLPLVSSSRDGCSLGVRWNYGREFFYRLNTGENSYLLEHTYDAVGPKTILIYGIPGQDLPPCVIDEKLKIEITESHQQKVGRLLRRVKDLSNVTLCTDRFEEYSTLDEVGRAIYDEEIQRRQVDCSNPSELSPLQKERNLIAEYLTNQPETLPSDVHQQVVNYLISGDPFQRYRKAWMDSMAGFANPQECVLGFYWSEKVRVELLMNNVDPSKIQLQSEFVPQTNIGVTVHGKAGVYWQVILEGQPAAVLTNIETGEVSERRQYKFWLPANINVQRVRDALKALYDQETCPGAKSKAAF